MVVSSLAASCCCYAENPLIPAVQISSAASLSDWQDKLIAQKQELLSLLGRPGSVQMERRQAPGTLIAAYTEALTANSTGLTSTEIVAWLDKNKPGLKTTSIPAVLSRGVDDGRLLRDDRGRYRLAY